MAEEDGRQAEVQVLARASITPVFTGFLGTLDGAGRATSTLDTQGPVPAVVGLTLHFAYGLNGPWNFASNAVAVHFSP